jgi:LacI family transcriptional regulator
MSFATKQPSPGRVALVLTPKTLRRLASGLERHVGPERDFGFVDISQPHSQAIAQMVEMNPAGIIMEYQEDLVDAVFSLNKPTVLVLADMLVEGAGCVNIDDFALGRQAADYLKSKGLRNFARIGYDNPHAPERSTGFTKTLVGGGFQMDRLELEIGDLAPPRMARTRHRFEKWLDALPKPAGIFAEQGELGREIVDACRRMEIPVPGDVAVLAVSDEPGTCELNYPAISSIEIPWAEIGLQAGNLMERQLRGEEAEALVLIQPAGIRTRGSSDYYRVSDERIQVAARFMQDHFKEPIDIAAVANSIGVNRRTLERLFRKELNTTPKQVLTEIRVRQARELLDQSTLHIGEIAEACGFTASEYLARAFRRRHGMSPREWRVNQAPSPTRPGY